MPSRYPKTTTRVQAREIDGSESAKQGVASIWHSQFNLSTVSVYRTNRTHCSKRKYRPRSKRGRRSKRKHRYRTKRRHRIRKLAGESNPAKLPHSEPRRNFNGKKRGRETRTILSTRTSIFETASEAYEACKDQKNHRGIHPRPVQKKNFPSSSRATTSYNTLADIRRIVPASLSYSLERFSTIDPPNEPLRIEVSIAVFEGWINVGENMLEKKFREEGFIGHNMPVEYPNSIEMEIGD